MKSLRLNGLGTALVTPFAEDGSVDVHCMEQLVERQLRGGVHMLVPCGTTGEGVTIHDDEYQQLVECVVRVTAGRVPVIAGAGSNATDRTIRTAALAQECGADAVLVVGPYYNKPTQEGYYQHFRAVAESVRIGVVLYNVPGRTSGNISASTQLRLAEIDNIVATKEASANFSQIMDIVAHKPEGFAVLSGDDNLALGQIAIGMDGVISVVSNEIPAEYAAMVTHALEGRFDEARRIHYRYVKLMETNFIESNPIPVKTAMAMMGLLKERFRLPLVAMEQRSREVLQDVLTEAGLL
jgi:4-hydroxy-tetrahydrodipicolinate synthase